MTRICVIGLGYIGLPTAVMLANAGHEVIGVDINQKVVENTNNGVTMIKEPDFNELFQQAISSGRLRAQAKIPESDAFLICVPTPFSKEDDSNTLAYVKEAMKNLIPMLKGGNIVILESTVPPGTTIGLLKNTLESTGLIAGKDFYLAYCPERLLPGNMVYEIINNDRIVGGIDQESAEKGKEIYGSFVKGQIITTDATTAEFVKVAENTYGAVNLGMVNELAQMCEKLGINVRKALQMANRHPRVRFMDPGPGVGGHCVPVDPWFLVRISPDHSGVIKAALEVNESMPLHVVSLVKDALLEAGIVVSGAKIVVLGVSYKKNVNDIRESPAIQVIKELQKLGCQIVACDPIVDDFFIPLVSDVGVAVNGANAIVLITDHDSFRDLDLEKLGQSMATRILVDTRNVFNNPDGYIYRQLGVGYQSLS
jgi:UDP-N-acetyl-D-mannosaminuronic acid dehydrogenase